MWGLVLKSFRIKETHVVCMVKPWKLIISFCSSILLLLSCRRLQRFCTASWQRRRRRSLAWPRLWKVLGVVDPDAMAIFAGSTSWNSLRRKAKKEFGLVWSPYSRNQQRILSRLNCGWGWRCLWRTCRNTMSNWNAVALSWQSGWPQKATRG